MSKKNIYLTVKKHQSQVSFFRPQKNSTKLNQNFDQKEVFITLLYQKLFPLRNIYVFSLTKYYLSYFPNLLQSKKMLQITKLRNKLQKAVQYKTFIQLQSQLRLQSQYNKTNIKYKKISLSHKIYCKTLKNAFNLDHFNLDFSRVKIVHIKVFYSVLFYQSKKIIKQHTIHIRKVRNLDKYLTQSINDPIPRILNFSYFFSTITSAKIQRVFIMHYL
eukprot:TRINITY_DN7173_c0_g1_i1.p1 TRINITY_DN7173_c0_g1~~TRINITY_DN7173_c0_g1_i1.p1  ORF type:complete len:217 (+),score=-20.58 TRINITY_DN7173_c0_g1_i1:360-1010(+)